jgi:copper transport protein
MRLLTLAIVLALALLPRQVEAHASLIDSAPSDGALLKESPSSIELTFNEPVEPLTLMLVDPGGDARRLDAGSEARPKITLRAPTGLARGTHLLSWRVVSADGHPVGGSIAFSIGQASGGDATASDAAASLVTATNPLSLIAARWLMLLGLGIGVAGAWYVVHLPEAEQSFVQHAVLIALGVGAVAALANIGLEGLEAHGLGLNAFRRSLTWRTGGRTHQGLTAELAILAMMIAAIALYLPRGMPATATSLVALLLAPIALIVSGHAATAPPAWLMPAVVAGHVAAVALWLGALLPLAFASLRPQSDLKLLATFSKGAVPVFACIVITGLVLAVVQAGSFSALLTTGYGRLLLAKLALVAIVLGIAAANRYRLTEPALSGDGRARATLGRNIAAEVLVAIVILAIVASWRITPPPRALAQMREPKFQIHMHGTDAMASVLIQPARVGPVKVVIEPKTSDLAPLRVKEVSLSLTGETPGVEPLKRDAKGIGGEQWEIEGLTIPSPGRWRLRVDLLINDFERTGLDAVIVVRP